MEVLGIEPRQLRIRSSLLSHHTPTLLLSGSPAVKMWQHLRSVIVLTLSKGTRRP